MRRGRPRRAASCRSPAEFNFFLKDALRACARFAALDLPHRRRRRPAEYRFVTSDAANVNILNINLLKEQCTKIHGKILCNRKKERCSKSVKCESNPKRARRFSIDHIALKHNIPLHVDVR
ncbi:hypothetical protein EVAR_30679_1 [Eumeta japonica]|uniref:Uncharacterized protein n=1 Tax=Eumeta variegata TaxID=151549 RepID=A0A4C1VRE9_EUMVA|nr:hypothetical protein EVAR_30679_1 [Eumeta japonica]